MLWLNGEPVVIERYPNGEARIEPSIILGCLHPNNHVEWRWDGDDELVHLAILRDMIHGGADLEIRYLPYSRMDRAQAGYAFSLKVVAQFINAMRWDTVAVWEPHSMMTCELLVRGLGLSPTRQMFEKVLDDIDFDVENDVVVFPDRGAADRYTYQDRRFDEYNVVTLDKTRDFSTGRITGLKLLNTAEIPKHRVGEKALIIDDLCSYGGTFVKAADLLRGIGYQYVYLLVTHLEPAAFHGGLFQKLDGVWASDSMAGRPEHPKLTTYTRKEWLS